MKRDTDVKALFETLRFAIKSGMSERMARAMFDRAMHELPDTWRVTHITPDAVAALVGSGFDKRNAKVERAHITQRNEWQRELLRVFEGENEVTFDDWVAKLRDYDQIVLTTRAENRANHALPAALLASCHSVPDGMFAAKSHSVWALGPNEREWLLGL